MRQSPISAPLLSLRVARRIAALLEPWADQPVPGMTIGVVQDGALTHHRSAGLASLELGAPIGPHTTFRIASVSKQFTCAAILLLAAEGRLALDDPAAAHVPGLPEQGVTIRHLMHNSSGIRDMLEIMRHGGADLGTPVRPEELLAGITRQRTLNFPPNSAYLYSNSNFLLLGRIAEAVSGEALAAFLGRRIFAPLGMTRTRLTERLTDPVPGLATGYLPEPGGYARAPHAFPLHGEGGLVSCVEDLALWSHHLDTDGAALAASLATALPFQNGAANFYARGQILRRWRGVDTVSHGGLWPGYKTEFLRVPQLRLTVIAIANNGGADPNTLALRVLDVLLDERPGIHPVPPRPTPAQAAGLAGRWVAPDGSATLDAAVENGRLVLRANGVPMAPRLFPDGWLAPETGGVALAVQPAESGTLAVRQSDGTVGHWRRAQPGALHAGLAGRYASTEMATTWTIAEEDGGWVVRVAGPVAAAGGPWPIDPVDGAVFRVSVPGSLFQAWMDVRAITQDKQVTALTVSGARTKDVRYERIRPV